MKFLPLDTAGTGHNGYQQHVKEANIKRIFDLVRSGKCRSRAELVRIMNLSATSVSVLVDELTERGLINETGPKQTSLPGRRPITLRLNRDAHQIAVFTLDRAGVSFDLLNLECSIIESRRFPFPSNEVPRNNAGEAYAQLFDNILNSQSQLFNPDRALALCVIFPGFCTQNPLALCLQTAMGLDIPLEPLQRLQQRMGLPLFFVGRTKCMAYAEKKYLDAASPDEPETRNMMFVRVGETIGGTIISDGNIYNGPFNVAGQIGHCTIDYHGRPCPCGNIGCLERYVSQSAILDDARAACREAGIEPPETFKELAQRADSEAVLAASLRRSAELLAFGLYSALCASGMRRLVLGGGIESLGPRFLQEVYHNLCKRSMLIHHLDLSYAQAGPDAASVGIAQYFLDKVFTITK
ncbi:MAG: ROK family transcriptional regulator [Clostridia bacterium]|nr:ROK family transcriptional regulator [Clostridia bacterium]